MNHEYVFVINGSLAPELRPQAARIAAVIPEALGRQQCPRLWKATDWLNARPKAAPQILEKRRKRRKWLGLLELLLALFALGPAMIAPEELLPVMLIGPLCLGAGIAALWRQHRVLLAVPLLLAGFFYGVAGYGGGEEYLSLLVFGMLLILVAIAALLPRGRRRKRNLEQAGNQLFDARDALEEGSSLWVRFTEEGLCMGTEEISGAPTPYQDLLAIIEAEELLLIGVKEQGFLMSKAELISGTFEEFREELSARVNWISAA